MSSSYCFLFEPWAREAATLRATARKESVVSQSPLNTHVISMIKILVSFLSLCCANHETDLLDLLLICYPRRGKRKNTTRHPRKLRRPFYHLNKHCWSCHSACKTSILLLPSTGSREASATPTDSQPGAIKAQTLEQGNHCCEWITLDHLARTQIHPGHKLYKFKEAIPQRASCR